MLCMQELFFVGWVDYLKHCKWSTFLQKERRVLTWKRTKMSNYLTHSYFVVDYVCCANKCNQKLTVLVPRIPVSTKCRQQTADRIQNIDCRVGTKCRLRISRVSTTGYYCTIFPFCGGGKKKMTKKQRHFMTGLPQVSQ